MLPNPKHTVILVGYQALGTRGRRLANGETEIKMHGEYVPVRATIEQIQSFSVHADVNELMDWLRSSSDEPGKVFVVHGEAGVAESLRDRIKSQLGWKAVAPMDGQIFEL
jgi:metallo-beta-lactamase family protein